MKIAILADTHDNLTNVKISLDYLNQEKINLLIHCGDIFNHDTVKFFRDNFTGECHFLISKDDRYFLFDLDEYKKNKQLFFYQDTGEIEISKTKISFTHFPQYISKLLKNKPDYLFYGHTHEPSIEQIPNNKFQITNLAYRQAGKSQISNQNNQNNLIMQQFNNITILANPGNVAGIFYEATLAILDLNNNNLELKILSKI